MNTNETFCLKWGQFYENIGQSFNILREENDFCDVTLACDDDEQIEAHKAVLAACSPFFKTLLKKQKHPHPLLYMRGIKKSDLISIVDFKILESLATPNWSKGSVGQEESRSQILSPRSSIPNTGFQVTDPKPQILNPKF